jgi:hypothetical protein
MQGNRMWSAGYTCQKAGVQLGMPPKTLANWVRPLRKQERSAQIAIGVANDDPAALLDRDSISSRWDIFGEQDTAQMHELPAQSAPWRAARRVDLICKPRVARVSRKLDGTQSHAR